MWCPQKIQKFIVPPDPPIPRLGGNGCLRTETSAVPPELSPEPRHRYPRAICSPPLVGKRKRPNYWCSPFSLSESLVWISS